MQERDCHFYAVEVKINSMLRLHFIVALFVGLLWSFYPSVQALLGFMTLPPVQIAQNPLRFQTGDQEFSAARKIQLHFLKFRVYIPFEDINIATLEQGENDKPLISADFSLIKQCNSKSYSIWVPFKYKIPVIGERVLQWCLNIPSVES